MFVLDLPLIIPSYMCFSRYFNNFIRDLYIAGIRKVIVMHDFDFSTSDIFSCRNSLKELKKNISPVFKSNNVKFEIVINSLLESKIYSLNELSCVSKKNSGYYFLTIPLSSDQSTAMENIFTLKNSGFLPVITSYEDISVIFKKSFCEALITTEQMSFVFDTDALSDDKIFSYVSKALLSHNIVAFSTSNFTTSIIERNISELWCKLDNQQRMNFGYLYHKLTNSIFK